MKRCPWSEHYSGAASAEYLAYHDTEWGAPSHDERHLFELLILEGAQAGLSWSTILVKRENYRRAFDNFDADKIAGYTPRKVEALMQDAGIVRNRLKIDSAIRNAKTCLELRERQGGLDPFLWRYVDGQPIQNRWREMKQVPARTELSDQISKDLMKLGFKFVGSTIVYAYMQAIGMVNDHLTTCYRYKQCAALGKRA